MGDVVFLGGDTTLPIPIERVLNGGKDAEFVLLLSCTKDGRFVAAASEADLLKCADAANRFLHKLYGGGFNRMIPNRYFEETQSCPSGTVTPIRSSNSPSPSATPPSTNGSGASDSIEKPSI